MTATSIVPHQLAVAEICLVERFSTLYWLLLDNAHSRIDMVFAPVIWMPVLLLVIVELSMVTLPPILYPAYPVTFTATPFPPPVIVVLWIVPLPKMNALAPLKVTVLSMRLTIAAGRLTEIPFTVHPFNSKGPVTG